MLQKTLSRYENTSSFLVKSGVFDKMKAKIAAIDEIHYKIQVLSILKCV